MASWQAHVLAWFCKQAVKRPLSKSPSITTIRRVFNVQQQPTPRGCIAQDGIIGGVRGEWMVADGIVSIGTMLYLHGGAYVACSPATHRPVTSWFAKQGWRVFAPDYRLAPEFKFPAQINDAEAVYDALLAGGVDPRKLVVAGDSAGGNLALALCVSLRLKNKPLPAAVAAFSPCTDYVATGDSVRSNSNRCAMFTSDLAPVARELYLGDHDPRDPLASPLYADLHGFPPLLFHVGEREILRDDSVRMAERAKQAGVEAELRVWPVVPHVWQLMHQWIPEGRESLAIADAFLKRHCGP